MIASLGSPVPKMLLADIQPEPPISGIDSSLVPATDAVLRISGVPEVLRRLPAVQQVQRLPDARRLDRRVRRRSSRSYSGGEGQRGNGRREQARESGDSF